MAPNTILICSLVCFLLIPFGGKCDVESSVVSPSHCLVFGSGISPHQHSLPMQYVYLQLRSSNNENITSPDVADDDITFKASSPHQERVFIMHYKHYLGNGLYLWRYRVNREVEQLTIAIKYKGVDVGGSPYSLGDVIPERCWCPKRSLDQWLQDNQCSSSYEQIQDSLRLYTDEGIKLKGLYERLQREFPRSHGVHYSIVDNKIYSRTFGSIYDFRYMSDMILLSLASKAMLPDVELIVQVADWPQDKDVDDKDPFPFLSWCGSENFRDLVWPQYDLMRSTIQGMERISLDTLMVQQSRALPWDQRIPKAFFRGRDSNRVRLDLVQKYWNQTDRFNVSLTSFFFFDYDEDLYGPKTPRISQLEFFKYKYQINIDGTVAAYRFPFMMASGSVIFKQASEYFEHFYHDLEPWVHYIPLKMDISDLEEKLQWAMDHDDEARQIAENAYQYYQDNLLPDKLYCYMYTLLKEYANLQIGEPRVHEGMVLVTEGDNPHFKPPNTDCKFCNVKGMNRKEEL